MVVRKGQADEVKKLAELAQPKTIEKAARDRARSSDQAGLKLSETLEVRHIVLAQNDKHSAQSAVGTLSRLLLLKGEASAVFGGRRCLLSRHVAVEMQSAIVFEIVSLGAAGAEVLEIRTALASSSYSRP
jgi:hypothetical protein